MAKTYRDKYTCPKCGFKGAIDRRIAAAGRLVTTYCRSCEKRSQMVAGMPKGEAENQEVDRG